MHKTPLWVARGLKDLFNVTKLVTRKIEKALQTGILAISVGPHLINKNQQVISRVLYQRSSILDTRYRVPPATYPKQHGPRYRFYQVLLQMGFTKPTGHPAAGALLPHRFILTVAGGLFSVALSLGLPPLAVSQHPALWSPDFPQQIAAIASCQLIQYSVSTLIMQVFSYFLAMLHKIYRLFVLLLRADLRNTTFNNVTVNTEHCYTLIVAPRFKV